MDRTPMRSGLCLVRTTKKEILLYLNGLDEVSSRRKLMSTLESGIWKRLLSGQISPSRYKFSAMTDREELRTMAKSKTVRTCR